MLIIISINVSSISTNSASCNWVDLFRLQFI